MKLFKYHSMTNDFLLFEGDEITPFLAANLCHRKTGFGADGVICYKNLPEANHYIIQIYNSDGTTAGLCGNGLACLCKHLHHNHGATNFFFHCQNQTFKADFDSKNNSALIHISHWSKPEEKYPFPWATEAHSYHIINVGNEHAIFFDNAKLASVQSHFDDESRFPDGININLAELLNPSEISLIVCERGCGVTGSCTSGALATAIAADSLNLATFPLSISQSGGTAVIHRIETGYIAEVKPEKIGRVEYEK
jgi:diaminopimelate epimerase